MRPSSAPRRPGALALLFLAALALAGGTLRLEGAERGFPLIQSYVPALAEVGAQYFGITRDPRGVLYFANAAGILVYDGAWWQSIPVGKNRFAFSVASDAAGRVAVGGVDELGYLAPDAKGTLRYISLLPLLPPGQRHLGQVMQIQPAAGGFAFLTSHWLFYWNGTRVTTVATLPGERPYPKSFAVGGEVFLWTRGGISRLAAGRLEPIPGGETFRDRVDLILPADRGLLVSVREAGLFHLVDGRVTPFAPEASRWTAAKKLYGGLRLPDGRWALGSILGGVLLLRPDGTVDQVIDSTVGLADDFVSGMVLDREGALWLALNAGLAKVEVGSPLSVIDGRSGLKGSIYNLTRHQGKLWVATASGLFTTEPAASASRPTPDAPEWGLSVRLRQVPGIPLAAWTLLSTGEDLLVGTAFGVWDLRGPSARLLPQTDHGTTYVLQRSRIDPHRVWVGAEDRLSTLYLQNGEWQYEGRIDGIDREIRSIVEGENGVVWCGTSDGGMVRVELPPAGSGLKPRVRMTEVGNELGLYRIDNRILATTRDRILRLDETRGELLAAPDLPVPGGGGLSQLAEDSQGNLWMNTHPPAILIRQGTAGARKVRSLVEVPARNIEMIFTEPDGAVWMAGENAVYRYAGPFRGEEAALPAPRLSRLSMGGGQLFFGGAMGARPGTPDLPPSLRHLRIEFAPLSFRAGLRYQTRLDPLDADWGPSAPEPFAEITRLPAGSYTFHVRTVGPNQEVGPEQTWSFRVAPPWYASRWALALWAVLAIGGLRAYGRLRGRALRQRAARLEARVAEQTVELRQTVEELRNAHSELEGANARLEELSLQDDLTGVANRRCLQQQLEKEWNRALWHRQPIGFVLLDLDEFKLLNDTCGHPEGDLTLQAVARCLGAAVRRAGDLLARYGGEEFAVLLPNSDLATTLAVAEELRTEVEALALPHPAATAGRVTASFGVASMTPAPNQPLEALVEAADHALYTAKTDGKNRVRAYQPRSVTMSPTAAIAPPAAASP
jgi:diguanylate cyclase (GGDEF)-like protein